MVTQIRQGCFSATNIWYGIGANEVTLGIWPKRHGHDGSHKTPAAWIFLHIWRFIAYTYEECGARNRYQRHGQVITFHRYIWYLSLSQTLHIYSSFLTLDQDPCNQLWIFICLPCLVNYISPCFTIHLLPGAIHILPITSLFDPAHTFFSNDNCHALTQVLVL